MPATLSDATEVEHCNEIRLVGRVAAEPAERVLPSGDELLQWRLVVERAAADRTTSRASVDVIECCASRAGVRRSARAWAPGDVVEIDGALRRRFWRGAAGVQSRYEVDVRSARRLVRG